MCIQLECLNMAYVKKMSSHEPSNYYCVPGLFKLFCPPDLHMCPNM